MFRKYAPWLSMTGLVVGLGALWMTGRTKAPPLEEVSPVTIALPMQINSALIYGEDVYAFRFLLVGKPSYIDAHPREVQRVLNAHIAAQQSIRADPANGRRLVGEAIKVDDALMRKIFDPHDYRISLVQALLLALDDETRWAAGRALVTPGPAPNYLKAINTQPLEAVLPAAVRIPHQLHENPLAG
jgi:NitT/TauT family transport system substrate-binding protein